MATRPHQAVAPDSSTTDLHATPPPHAIAPPRDLFKRHPATTVSRRITTGEAIDFSPPTFSKLKVRPDAHLVDGDYLARLGKAMQLLRDLPPEDPRSHYQQLPIHCIPYQHREEEEEEETQVQVQSNWLFFPWHRIHLYFFERILCKLIRDGDFAIPFWEWDQNPNNNSAEDNFTKIHYFNADKTAEHFMGGKHVTGSLERALRHNIQIRVDGPGNPYGEGKRNFYSSGRDAMFYGLHANADRMWDVWTKKFNHNNLEDEEWLTSAFYLYDENGQLVRVRVSDILDSEKLGYTYEELP